MICSFLIYLILNFLHSLHDIRGRCRQPTVRVIKFACNEVCPEVEAALYQDAVPISPMSHFR